MLRQGERSGVAQRGIGAEAGEHQAQQHSAQGVGGELDEEVRRDVLSLVAQAQEGRNTRRCPLLHGFDSALTDNRAPGETYSVLCWFCDRVCAVSVFFFLDITPLDCHKKACAPPKSCCGVSGDLSPLCSST